MANTKISALSDGSYITAGDKLVIARGGSNFAISSLPTGFGTALNMDGATQGNNIMTGTNFVYAGGASGTTSGIQVQAWNKGTSPAGPTNRFQGFTSYLRDLPTVVNKTVSGTANNGSGLIRMTVTSHGFSTGDSVAIYQVTGTTEANGQWIITNIDANHFDLQGSTFTNAYIGGGFATNRPAYYGYFALVGPTIGRGGLTGTASHGDDVAGYVAFNAGTAIAADAFFIGRNSGIAGSEWNTAFSTAANVNVALNIAGTIGAYGIDFQGATFGTSPAIRLPNNVGVYARNAANSADTIMFKFNASNWMEIDCPLNLADGIDVVLGSTTGSRLPFASSQKLGFWGATPVVQQSTVGTATGYTAGATTGTFHTDDKYSGNTGSTGYTINGIVNVLKTVGILAP